MLIEGPTKGTKMKVNDDGSINAVTASHGFLEHESLVGRGYNIVTEKITLTSAGESGVLYVQNTNPDLMLVLDSLVLTLGASTGGAASARSEVISYRGPTGGTLISAGTDITPVNRNLGITTPAQMVAKKGAEGATITGGTVMLHSATTAIISLNRAAIGIPNGSSFAMSITPPLGNTNMSAFVNILCYYASLHGHGG
jgi:hypothetical protein